MLGGCGGGPAATTQPQPETSAPELRWAAQVEGFVKKVLPDLKRLERLTGGSAKRGAIGKRLDPAVFRPGPARRQFEATMEALSLCAPALATSVPAPPSKRFRQVRATLVHACDEFELLAELLRADVRRASAPEALRAQALADAGIRADEGVRSVTSALTTLERLLAAPQSP